MIEKKKIRHATQGYYMLSCLEDEAEALSNLCFSARKDNYQSVASPVKSFKNLTVEAIILSFKI